MITPRAGLSLLVCAALLAGCASAPPAPRQPGSAAQPPPPAHAGALRGPEWARDAVFYEVFVRSFQDSDGDGVGDLRGLISRLDELNDGDPARGDDLGVTALWLMPTFESPSYHGYDIVDYTSIDREYGTLQDFERLVAEARARGIRIVLDFMINHSSNRHPWFAESAASPDSPRRHWYVWRADDPGWTQPWGSGNRTWHPHGNAFYYGLFWSGMPDLNLRRPEVREEVRRIARLWLERGAAGFRLDAARHAIEGEGGAQADTPETHEFWREFSAYVASVDEEAYLVGENWADTATISTYFADLPSNFNFPLAEGIVRAAHRRDPEPVLAVLAEMERLYPAHALDATFLTNHDMRRVASLLGNDAGMLRSAAALLLTLPGTPFLYYGEEVGLQNGLGGGDEAKRTPMPWDASPGGGFTSGAPWHPFAPGRETANVAAQRRDPGSLHAHYRALIAARHASPALRRGRLALVDAPPGVLAFTRATPEEAVYVAHNLWEAAVTVQAPVPLGRALFASEGAKAEGATVTLPGNGSGAWIY